MSNPVIRDIRKNLGLSQEKVAREAGLSLQHFNMIEKGHVTNITKDTMTAIAKALNTSVTELFFPEELKV